MQRSEHDALSRYFAIATEILAVDKSNQLPAIKSDIEALKPHHDLIYQLLTFQYYVKCIDLKIYLYYDELQEYKKCKDNLDSTPLPSTEFSAATNLLYTLIIVSMEVARLPFSIANIPETNWFQYFTAISSVLLIVANHDTSDETLELDIRNGLSCFLFNSHASNSAIDIYAKSLANTIMIKLGSWYREITQLHAVADKTEDATTVKGISRICHLSTCSTIIMTLGGCLNGEDFPDHYLYYLTHERNLMHFNETDPADCEKFQRRAVERVLLQASDFILVLHHICYERFSNHESSQSKQLHFTGMLLLYYLQNMMLRLDNKDNNQLNTVAKILCGFIIDAHPNKKNEHKGFSKLWLRQEVIKLHDKTSIKMLLDCGIDNEAKATLISIFLVNRFQIALSTTQESDTKARDLIFDNLITDIHSLFHEYQTRNNKSKSYILPIILDLYNIGEKNTNTPQEKELFINADMMKFIGSFIEKIPLADIYRFVLDEERATLGKNIAIINKMKTQDIVKIANKNIHIMERAIKKLRHNETLCMNHTTHLHFAALAMRTLEHFGDAADRLGDKLVNFYEKLTSRVNLLQGKMASEAIQLLNEGIELSALRQQQQRKVIKPDFARSQQISRSFVPLLPIPPSNPPAKSRKKIRTLPNEPGVITPLPPPLHVDFSLFENYFQQDYSEIREHFEPILLDHTRREIDRYFALVHLTRCLEKLEDQSLADLLLNHAEVIFRTTRKFFESGSEFKPNQCYVYTVLARWEPIPEVLSPTPIVEVKPIVTVTEASLFKKPVYNKKKKKPIKPVIEVKPTLNDMLQKVRPHHQKNPLIFPFKPCQWKIMLFLRENHHPAFIHGSSILSLIRDTKVNDIDLLCYIDSIFLLEYFSDDKVRSEFDISMPYVDMDNPQILTLVFNAREANGEPIKMEVLCRGKMDDAAIIQDMKALLASYYISNMFCDPYSGWLVDLYHQYDSIAHWHKFINIVDHPDPTRYFHDTPLRMIDLIIRLAFFQSQGKPFVTNYALRKGLISNEQQINFIKFDKLFLRKHARESFDELITYDLFFAIMPAFRSFNRDQLDEIRAIFADLDQHLKQTYPHDLTDSELAQNRIELLSRLVACGRRHLNLNEDEILNGINLKKIGELARHIKEKPAITKHLKM